MPAKGMTLPFISYGGSSMISLAWGMGMLLALTRERPRAQLLASNGEFAPIEAPAERPWADERGLAPAGSPA
jgi:cell division protein FtsW